MPHGDFSDIAAFSMLAGGVQSIFYTELSFQAIGPLKPAFAAGADGPGAGAVAAVKSGGGLMLILFAMLFSVRWNTVNGKMSGLFALLAAANLVQNVLGGHEALVADVQAAAAGDYAGKFSLLHVQAAVLVVAGLHLMFNANPMIKAGDAGKGKRKTG